MVVLGRCCCCSIYYDKFVGDELDARYEFEPGDWERTGGSPPSARMTSNGGGPVKIYNGLANVFIQFRYTGISTGDTITIRAGTHLEWQIGPAVSLGSGAYRFPISINGYAVGNYLNLVADTLEYNFHSILRNSTENPDTSDNDLDYVTLGEWGRGPGVGDRIPIDRGYEFATDLDWEWEIEASAGVGIAQIEVISFSSDCLDDLCNACSYAREGTAPSSLYVSGIPSLTTRWYDAVFHGHWAVPLFAAAHVGSSASRHSTNLSPLGPAINNVSVNTSESGFGILECAYRFRMPSTTEEQTLAYTDLTNPAWDDTQAFDITTELDGWIGALSGASSIGDPGDVLVVVRGQSTFQSKGPDYLSSGWFMNIYGYLNTGKKKGTDRDLKIVWEDLVAAVPLFYSHSTPTLWPDVVTGSPAGVLTLTP